MVNNNYKQLSDFQHKQGNLFINLILIILLLVSFSVLIVIVWSLYMDTHGNPEFVDLSFQPQLENQDLSQSGQFYPNMKFNHNSISYNIESICNQEKHNRMLLAFEKLSNIINEISFYPVSANPDIEISCSEKSNSSMNKKNYFIAGEGGAKEIVQTGDYNVIINGLILLYENKRSIECDAPNTELHELIHVFGFGHSENENSLMYPYLKSCNQKLDESIIKEIKKLYSEENLPDLYFENLKVVKKGRYMDFNITIKNSGTLDAENIKFDIFDGAESIQDKKIDELKFGAGIIFETKNLKLNSRNSKEIEFILDKDNEIREINKTNNIVKIKFNDN